MPDRHRRAALRLPLPALAMPVPPLLRGRRSSSDTPPPDGNAGGPAGGPAGPGGSEREDNPFAAPPEGRPDQAWQPRRPQGRGKGDDRESGGGDGPDGNGQNGNGSDSEGQDDGRQQPPSWGKQWSSRQPGRQGGFGAGPGRRQNGANNGQGPERPGRPGGLRWDPKDPVQRRARYALLSGMWAFFFALFSLPEIALLLGALALYWGVSSLRSKSTGKANGAQSAGGGRTGERPAATAQDVGGAAPASEPGNAGPGAKPLTTAAVSGLVTGGLALAVVAATYALQFVYSDYYACVNDALTQSSQQSCERLLPEELRPLLSTPED